MNTIENSEIGTLYFDYGWVKKIAINFNGGLLEINCVFEAFEDEDITNEQRSSYIDFENKKEFYEEKLLDMLNHYIEEQNINVAKVEPSALFFKRDGAFGLLCDCSWDRENGIVIILHPEERVDVQDIFI